jgi:hypothetical protein
MGMSGHESAGPLRACVKVADYCDPPSAGTLTCIKSLEAVLRATLPPYVCDSQYRIVSFVLVRTIRSSLHCIKSPYQRTSITSLKVLISPLSETKSKPESFMILIYGDPLNSVLV